MGGAAPRAVTEPEEARPPSPSLTEAGSVARMSYMLPHLHNGWQVDQAILSEEDRVVVIRFGHDWDPTCMKMDEVLYSIAEKVTRLLRFTLGPLVSSVFNFFCFASWQENVKAVKNCVLCSFFIS